jgi:hypothetical protein
MSIKRALIVVVVASALLLAVGVGPQFTGTARALPPAQEPGPMGATVSYPGQLTDEAGQAVADGAYDFTFALYDAESDGQPLWTETQEGVAVQGGAFTALLGSVAPIPKEVLEGGARWLAVGVRGPGEGEFTALAPRQQLSTAASMSPASPSAGLACPHDHLYESWVGSNAYYTFRVQNTGAGDGIRGYANTTNPIFAGVYGYNAGNGGSGVYGDSSSSGSGVYGRSGSGAGVNGTSTSGAGVYGMSTSGAGVHAVSSGSYAEKAALRAYNSNTTSGVAAWFYNNSGWPTAEFDQRGGGRVLDLQNNGTGTGEGSGDFIAAFNLNAELRFRVGGKGDVWTRDGYYTISGDLAEMLPAVQGVEPGDVLAIGLDGQLARSTQAYQASVMGVYSTQPGFVGGQAAEGEIPGAIPLAVVGVVPVKVSAENGPIRPGDLLVASSTPGHAMKAGPNPPQGTVIGKALEGLDEGTGVMKMLATLQ